MEPSEMTTVEGRNPVFEALCADLPVEKIYISNRAGGSQITKIIEQAKKKAFLSKRWMLKKLMSLPKQNPIRA